MPRPVLITARALRDVDEAITWRVGYSLWGAARWHAALLKRIQTLQDKPEQWPLAVEADRVGVELRELTFGKRRNIYRILFTVSPERVTVHHVRHTARNWLASEELVPEDE